jgi:hypothetical protein
MYKITIKTPKSIQKIDLKNWEQSFEFFMKTISDHGINDFRGHGYDIHSLTNNVPQLVFSAFSDDNQTHVVLETTGSEIQPLNDVDNYEMKPDHLRKLRFFLRSIDARQMPMFDDKIEIWEKNGHLISIVENQFTFDILISQQFETLVDACSFIKSKFES